MSDDATLTADPAASEQPLPVKGRKVNLAWRDDFLADYEANGGFYHAAKVAGVDSTTAYAEMARNPAFKVAAEEARQRFADSQEDTLRKIGDAGNPVGPIVLLKKHRPHEFIEKTVNLSLTAHTELPAEDGRQLLMAMFGQGQPASITERSEQP